MTKTLIAAAAVAAISAGLFAADGEGAPKAGEGAEPAAVAPAANVLPPGATFDRAKVEARLKKRQNERRVKVAEVLKAAGLPEDKVGAAVDEIDKIYARRPPQRPVRHGGVGGKRPPRPRAKSVPEQQ